MPPKVQPFVLNKKLILHFDLEDVVIYEHDNKQLEIFKLITGFAWGKIEQKDAKSPQVWKLNTPSLSKTQPQPQQPLLSYKEYVESIHSISQTESLENIQQIEKKRQQLYLNFTKGPGGKLKTQIQKLFRSITLPKTLSDFVSTQQQSKEEVNKDYRVLIQKLAKGKYQILPVFYKLMMNLKKNKRQFGVVFHAKKDVKHQQIIGQLNLFFNGQHPFYNGKNNTPLVKFDGSKNCKNFRLTTKNICTFYRLGKKYQDDYTTFGTVKNFQQKQIDGLKQKLLQIKDQTKLCRQSQIYIYSHLLLKESAAIYCIDSEGVMMIDPADYNTQQIYFSSRNVQIWSCLGQQIYSSEGIYSIKVELFQLLKDIEFFIKNIEIAEKNMITEIDRIEKGQGIIKEPKQQQTQPLSDSDYLKRNIIPLLEGALRLVDIERPEDPISAIAFYCLKNQHWLVKPEDLKTQNS